MAIRDKMRANAGHLLQHGETIEAVFSAQITSGYYAFLSPLIVIFANGYRVIIVTDRRILVCRSGRFRVTPVKDVIRELPRNTRIGPPSGLWWRCETLGELLYIHKRFHKDVTAADTVLA